MTAPDPLGPVYIGAREIYDRLVVVNASVDRLSNQISTLADSIRDHETRLRTLERARWPLPSLAVVASLASLGLSVITNR